MITEWSAWSENETIAKPAIFAIRKNGSIAWAYVGRDFADRPTDDELFRAIREGD